MLLSQLLLLFSFTLREGVKLKCSKLDMTSLISSELLVVTPIKGTWKNHEEDWIGLKRSLFDDSQKLGKTVPKVGITSFTKPRMNSKGHGRAIIYRKLLINHLVFRLGFHNPHQFFISARLLMANDQKWCFSPFWGSILLHQPTPCLKVGASFHPFGPKPSSAFNTIPVPPKGAGVTLRNSRRSPWPKPLVEELC